MKKIYSSLMALALSVFMSGSVFAASEVKAVDEVTPAVDQLDGKILVVTDATGEYILSNQGTGNHNMTATAIAEISDLGALPYCLKFSKIEVAGVEGNLYLLQSCKKSGEVTTQWWQPAYLNFQPTGQNIIFALGLNNQNGQDAPNCAVWDVTYEEGNGYVLHNVGNTGYLNPAISAPSAEKAYVRLYDNINKIDIFDISELEAAINAAKAIENPTEGLVNAIAKAEHLMATVTTGAEVDEIIAALNEAIKEDKKVKLMANPQAGDDMTLFIVNPDFETKTLNGWDCNLKMQNNGNLTANYAEMWSGSAANVVGAYIKQTITLPAGKYALSADVVSRRLDAVLYAGENTCACNQLEDPKGTTSTVEFTLNEAGEIEIGYKATGSHEGGDGWFAIDNVKLTYVDAVVTTAISAVNAAPAAKNGKFIIDGNIVIVRNNQKYNVAGQAVK